MSGTTGLFDDVTAPSVPAVLSGGAVPVPAAPLSPLAGMFAAASERAPDMTNQYNTALQPAEEAQYQQWIAGQSAQQGRDISGDNYDYDMRGAWQAGLSRSDNGHFPDTFKKPNHPTFSVESQYSTPVTTGGTWGGDDAQPTFTPSPANRANMGRDNLTRYFQRVEPNAKLIYGDR